MRHRLDEFQNEGKEHEPMRLSFAIGARLFYTFVVVFLMLPAAFARERGPRVEVVCPSPPVPVKLAEKHILVYELHITNFESVPLTLKRLEVFADTNESQPLTIISGDALSAITIEAGSMSATKDSQTIAPAKRAIIFMWIELAPDKRVPVVLLHRIVFAAGEPGSTMAETALEKFPVVVSQEAVPLLSSPFDGGIWLAGDGPSNDSDHRLSIVAIDGHVHIAQKFAIDWVKVGPNGDSHNGTARNENWWGYGEPTHSVADGEVTQIVDGIPENTPRVLPTSVTLDNIAGNYVTVRIASNRYVTYAHLQGASIRVHLHDQVHRGDVLARLGNSGNATGPHLHFQVTDGNSLLESEGVPFIFNKFTDLGPGSAYELDKHISVPREHSIPGNNAVVEFTPLNQP
jgi:murein DD-endopeptidase